MLLKTILLYGGIFLESPSDLAAAGQVTTAVGFWTEVAAFLSTPLGGILISLATAAGTTIVTYWIEKRREARYGRHRKLNIALKDLKDTWEKTGCNEEKNPFALRYTVNVIRNKMEMMPCGERVHCIKTFSPVCKSVEKLIMEEDNNIKPKGVHTNDWNSWQSTVHKFTWMIINIDSVEQKKTFDNSYTKSWKEFETAVNSLINETEYSVNGAFYTIKRSFKKSDRSEGNGG